MKLIVGVVLSCIVGAVMAQPAPLPFPPKPCSQCITPYLFDDGRTTLACSATKQVNIATFMKPLRVCGLCTGYTISKRGDDVLFRCPSRPYPWLIVKDCKNPKVVRSGPRNSNVSVTCNT